MPIIQIILLIVAVGVILWLVNAFIPMTPPIKQILNAVVVILIVVWLISLLIPGLWHARIGTP